MPGPAKAMRYREQRGVGVASETLSRRQKSQKGVRISAAGRKRREGVPSGRQRRGTEIREPVAIAFAGLAVEKRQVEQLERGRVIHGGGRHHRY